MNNSKRIISGLLLLVLVSACSHLVKLTSGGEKVLLGTKDGVRNCRYLGKTNVSVKANVAGFDRNTGRVAEELEMLGRNSAANMKGDTLLAVSSVNKGAQTFKVYRCK